MSRDIYVVLIIVLVGFGSFGLGKLSVATTDAPAVSVGYVPTKQESVTVPTPVTTVSEATEEETVVAGGFVASKNGTKYHYPWCPGASQIKDENKVWFETREAAEAAGYTPAANCKGL